MTVARPATVALLANDTNDLFPFVLWLVIALLMFAACFGALAMAYRRPTGETFRPDASGPPPVEFNFTDRERKLFRQASRDVARRTERGDLTWLPGRKETDDEHVDYTTIPDHAVELDTDPIPIRMLPWRCNCDHPDRSYPMNDVEVLSTSRTETDRLWDEVQRLRAERAMLVDELNGTLKRWHTKVDQARAERDRARATAVTLEQDAAKAYAERDEALRELRSESAERLRLAEAIQRVRDVHTESTWYRAPGHDRLWPSKEDAAYYNAPNETFTANDVETVTICGECSGEDDWPSTVSTADYKAVAWPCATITALDGEAPDGD